MSLVKPVQGNFRTTPGASIFNKYIKGNTDAFVIKFKANGNQVEWAKLMGWHW